MSKSIAVVASLTVLLTPLLVSCAHSGGDPPHSRSHGRIIRAESRRSQVSLADLTSEDPKLAEWVEKREQIFDLVLELRAAIGPPGEDRLVDPDEVLGTWETLSGQLPEEDILRERCGSLVAKALSKVAPQKAASVSERTLNPALAAAFYRENGKPEEANRLYRIVDERRQQRYSFAAEWALRRNRGVDLNDWLDKQPVMSRVKFLTCGVDDPWVRQRNEGFSCFVASLPKNLRLRRVMTLYYAGCVEDNCNSVDGELNIAEPILRTTALTFPDALGITYRWLVEAGTGEDWWPIGPLRIPGDWGPTGNAIRLTADLLHAAPQAKTEILAVAQQRARSLKSPAQRCRWMALVAYLEDGSFNTGSSWQTVLLQKLSGDVRERRWALAWLPNELAEHAPKSPTEVLTPELSAAAVEAANKCVTTEDKILACDAVGALPPRYGLDFAVGIASESQSLDAWPIAVHAIRRHYIRLGGPSELTRERPLAIPPEFARLLSTLRKAFYPHFRDPLYAQFAMQLLADLRDEGLDEEIASQLLASRDPQLLSNCSSLMHCRKRSRKKIVAAIEILAQDKTFKHSEQAARILQSTKEAKELNTASP